MVVPNISFYVYLNLSFVNRLLTFWITYTVGVCDDSNILTDIKRLIMHGSANVSLTMLRRVERVKNVCNV